MLSLPPASCSWSIWRHSRRHRDQQARGTSAAEVAPTEAPAAEVATTEVATTEIATTEIAAAEIAVATIAGLVDDRRPAAPPTEATGQERPEQQPGEQPTAAAEPSTAGETTGCPT